MTPYNPEEQYFISPEAFFGLKPLRKYELLCKTLEFYLAGCFRSKRRARRSVSRQAPLNALIYKNVKQLPTLSDLGSTPVDNPRLAAIALPLMKKIATTPSKAKISFLLIIPPFFLVIYYAGFSPRMT